MKERKTFDCVRMKDEIQNTLLSQWEGMSDTEVIQKIRGDLDTSDSLVAAWWRDLQHTRRPDSQRSAVAH